MNSEMAIHMQEYRREQRNFWLTTMLPMAAIGAVIIFGGCYLLSQFAGPDAVDWRGAAAFILVLAMIPPYLMMRPAKPTVESVKYDRLLNEIGRAGRR